jgi:hypothetical protein
MHILTILLRLIKDVHFYIPLDIEFLKFCLFGLWTNYGNYEIRMMTQAI